MVNKDFQICKTVFCMYPLIASVFSCLNWMQRFVYEVARTRRCISITRT